MRRLIPFAFLLLTSLLLANPALAELTFCNDTDQSADVAIGYSKDDTWISEGWWPVAPDKCTVVIGGDLERRYYYWRATTANGPFFVPERILFCVTNKAFTIEGDGDCAGRGFEEAEFVQVDVGEARDFTVRLTPVDAPRPGTTPSATPPATPPAAPPPTTATLPAQDPFVPLRAVLQGRWQDQKNTEFEMVVRGDRFTDVFQGQDAAQGSYRLQTTCANARLTPVMVVTYDGSPDGPLCWELIVLTLDSLQFRPVGRDNIVEMHKR